MTDNTRVFINMMSEMKIEEKGCAKQVKSNGFCMISVSNRSGTPTNSIIPPIILEKYRSAKIKFVYAFPGASLTNGASKIR